MIWDQIESRYKGCTRKPITVNLCFVPMIDGAKLKLEILERISCTEWPDYLKEWHKKQLRIVTTSSSTIEDRLCNVTNL